MAAIRMLLVVVGMLCLFMGLLWVGQGTGLVHWPADSFMIDVSGWALRGACLAAVGIGLIFVGRRLGRR